MKDFTGKIYLGVVEDNNDPERDNKCKVRVINLFDGIPTEDLPWASPFKDNNGIACSLPECGKIVSIEFENGDIYNPLYRYSEHYNVNLKEKLDSLSDEDYLSMKALLFDHKTQIYTNEGEGLKLDHKFNVINITDESINLNLKDNFGCVHIGTEDANQQAILGNHFLDWFSTFVDHLLGSEGGPYFGNMLAPVLPHPTLITHLLKYKALKEPKFLSHNIYFNDNTYVDKLNRVNKAQDGDDWKSTAEDNESTKTDQSTGYEAKSGTKDKTPPNKEEKMPEEPDTNDDVIILIKLLQNKGYEIYTEESKMNIVGIRYQYEGEIYSNKFKDKLWVFYKDSDNNWQIKNFKLSTLPGSKILITDVEYKKFKSRESSAAIPPDKIPIEYSYSAGNTFDNNGNLSGISTFISNNVGLPIIQLDYSHVTFTPATATETNTFQMDNFGDFKNNISYPKTGTPTDVVGTGEAAVSDPVVSRESVIDKTISLKKYSQYIGESGLKVLQPAQYINTYQLGNYPESGEFKSKALIATEKQVVFRDSDWDSDKIVYSSEEEGNFELHISRGFPGGESVDAWSEGSQVISSNDSLKSFIKLMEKHEQSNSNVFTYTLSTSNDYEEAQLQVGDLSIEEKKELSEIGKTDPEPEVIADPEPEPSGTQSDSQSNMGDIDTYGEFTLTKTETEYVVEPEVYDGKLHSLDFGSTLYKNTNLGVFYIHTELTNYNDDEAKTLFRKEVDILHKSEELKEKVHPNAEYERDQTGFYRIVGGKKDKEHRIEIRDADNNIVEEFGINWNSIKKTQTFSLIKRAESWRFGNNLSEDKGGYIWNPSVEQ